MKRSVTYPPFIFKQQIAVLVPIAPSSSIADLLVRIDRF